MRSRSDIIPPYAGVERGLAHGLCGIGGRLDAVPGDLAEALALTEARYGDRAAARLRRWHDVPVGSTVWTRDEAGEFHVGTVTGSWTYDGSPEAELVDLVHVRSCTWRAVPDDDVPEAVVETFARGGRNFQRITRL